MLVNIDLVWELDISNMQYKFEQNTWKMLKVSHPV